MLIVTFLTYFDSGIFKSDLTLLYYLIIISAGLFFNDRGSIIIATLVSLFYVTSIILIFNDVIPVHDVSGGIVVFGGEYQMAYLRLFINLVMFYVTSFVISNLKIAYR